MTHMVHTCEGVVQFVFSSSPSSISQICAFRFSCTSKSSSTTTQNLWWIINTNQIENQTYLDWVMVIISACLLVLWFLSRWRLDASCLGLSKLGTPHFCSATRESWGFLEHFGWHNHTFHINEYTYYQWVFCMFLSHLDLMRPKFVACYTHLPPLLIRITHTNPINCLG
jgi:hypothetical protein